MTQNERWIRRYKEVMDFMGKNHRRPSKYYPGERNAWNWLRHALKQYRAGNLKQERMEPFAKLVALDEQCRHRNQYV